MKPVSAVSTSAHRTLRASLLAFTRLLLVTLCLGLSVSAFAGNFVVNTGTTDLDDKTPGDGVCADSAGMCSLRAAIDEANATTGPHSITFAPSALVVLVINGSLPALTAPVIMTGPVMINGKGNAFKHGCLDLEDTTTGVNANGATGSTLTLLSIVNCSGDGIVANGHGYQIIGNFIGVDPTGLIAMGNGGNGIILSASHTYGNFVDTNALDTLFQSFPPLPVTGTDVQVFVQNLATKLVTLDPITISGNVISANTGDGINIHSENLGAVFVSGNMIGTDITGNVANGNMGSGVNINAFAFGNVIGPNNVISGNLGNGVTVDSPTVYLPNFIMGNRIGLASTLSSAHIGNGLSGISSDTAPDNSMTNKNPSGMSLLIGPANIVSDNQGVPSDTDPDSLSPGGGGVYITGSSNRVSVVGNTIGMAEFPAGTPLDSRSYGNAGHGVIVTANGNTIGGSSAGSGNVIAGNGYHGIYVTLDTVTSTHILGNTIGLYPPFASDLTLGNGFDGIRIDASSSTYVGGPGANDFNVIAGNGRNGVKIMDGGMLNGWGNLVQRNQIFSNAKGNAAALPTALMPGVGVGIDLDFAQNISNPLHTEIPANYANLDQSQPVICSGAPGEPTQCGGFTPPHSVGGATSLSWTIATHGPATFNVEFYQIDSADDNTATGMTYLGTQQITTDATGLPNSAGCSGGLCNSSITGNSSGAFVLMTATDVTPLTDQAIVSTNWQNGLLCFAGDLGVILSSCPVNDTSEYSNVVAVPDNNANLSNLMVSSGTLMPSFATATQAYTDAVTNATTSVTVTPTLADINASVTVNGTPVANGSASGAINLNVGMNAITVLVTAQDGVTTQTYTVQVNRAAALSNNAALSNLAISSGTLAPTFATATLAYTDAVTNGTTSVTVTPTVADATATVKVNGTPVTSGSPSGAINLNVGANAVTVLVTAQDGTTTQTYTVTVNRAGALSNNASLSNLTISSGTLTPTFATATLAYSDAVTNATTTVTVTPTVADATATVQVNGTTVTSGSPSGAINLNVGMNPVTVLVTAQDGTTTQTYTIAVNRAGALSNNASLSGLTISSGSLVPVFASTTLVYTDAVANATTSVTVTPTVADPTATVKVNGTAVTSGSASAAINLNVGMNAVSVLVTAQDGTTTQTYTITVNRAGALSNNASLSSLTISSGTLTPAFATATLAYTDAVTNATTSVTVTPTVADATATVKVNGTTVTSGTASGAINLNVGANVVTVLVTAQDGTTTQTYTITVNRAGALSNNASLSSLTISSGSLVPSFITTTLAYTDAVTNATTSVTVTPTVADATATVKVNGTTVTSGSASGAINLNVGMNAVTVLVTAQDGTTTQTYTITVNRAGALSNNASLSSLTVSSGTLTPAFATATLAYTDAVTNATTTVTVTPTVADATATVKVNGTTVASGSASGAINLNVGANAVTVLVTAQDGTTTQTYTITVNRAGALSNNASLSNLSISSGSLVPSFVSTTLAYTDAVTNATTSLTVTPTLADPTATVKVNGTTVTSGSASGAINLNVGMNTAKVLVTAQDGTTTQTYTITVNRAGALSNNASLSSLTISSGTLTPAFATATLAYTDAVTNATTSVTVTPTVADATATVKVNGTTVTSGTASGAINLNVGANVVTVLVTAQDGTTTQAYTISVNRAGALSNNASLSNLTVSSGSLVPSFVSTTLGYNDAVTNATTSVTVTPTVADPTATVRVNGTAVTSGSASGAINLNVGANTVTVLVTAQDGTTTKTYTIAVNRANALVTIFSGPTFTNTGTATAVLSGGGATCSFGTAAFVGAPVAPPAGVSFPDGLFQFTAVNCVGSISVNVTFPTVFTGTEEYLKYGPTPGPVAAHWYALGAANNLVLSGHAATFTIADGGLGDDDLTVNGTIVDQGGPAVPAGTGGNPGGGVVPTPALSTWALWMLSGLLVLAGVAQSKRRVNRRRA
jgi:CSLREA domain-containing protein